MKRFLLIAMILVAVVAFQVSAGGGDEETAAAGTGMISDKVINPSFMFRSNLSTLNNDSLVFQLIGQKTNIYFDVTPVPVRAFAEKISTVLASGDMPDLISLRNGRNLTIEYGPQGAWVPLNDYVDSGRMPTFKKYMDEITDDSWQVLSAQNGKFYGTPRLYTYTMLHESFMARTDLMKDWGFGDKFDSPEDLTNFLRRAKKEYPNSTPVGNRWGANTIIRGMAHQYFSNIGMWFDHDTDQYIYGPAKDGFEEFMEYLHTWYAEGLLDPEWGTTSDEVWKENLLNDKAFFVYDYMTVADGMTADGKKKNPNYEYAAVVPFSGDAGHDVGQAERYHDVYFLLKVISAKSKYIEELVDFLEWCYTEEGVDTVMWGEEGNTFVKNADGTNSLTDKVKTLHNPDGAFVPGENGIRHEFTAVETIENVYAFGMGPLARKAWGDHIEAGAVMQPQPFPIFTDDELARKTQIESSVNTYMNELMVNMITGKVAVNTWDSHIETLKGMGIDELVKLYNTGYDRVYR
ncbi:MAG: extracellular solute-binding protein [Spirochaetales bacterium]|jgi:putative aldouronate transport system substrate-binding protein|nr:extracellular solute-binding protein [Spirochaetales bacterium]